MIHPDALYALPSHIHTRWASAENFAAEKGGACRNDDGRKRSPSFPLAAGEARTLLDIKGTTGVVRRIWITINDRSAKMLRGIRIDAFWDGADTPAVSAPLADFFSLGLGRMATFQSALFSSPEGRSFNCYIPMPFRKAARIVARNETDTDLSMFFYDIDCTVGDEHPVTMGYLHAHWRRENPTVFLRDYELLPRVEGRGRFLGCNVGVIPDKATYFRSWWGEGEVKAYLDGDTDHPSLCGTGTEDYIGTGWGQGQYANLYQGCHVADREAFQYCFYRLHLPDPVWFHKDARITIHQIGCWSPDSLPQLAGMGVELKIGTTPIDVKAELKRKGYGLFERRDDWSSCAWFYLDRPVNALPPLPPVEQRVAGLA
ncbi:DUF2961 domain-containing protein [bacterium]|nr:DUF2961 domain-containing protein [bacterium]